MSTEEDLHVLRLPSARAVEEKEMRRDLTSDEYELLRALAPEVGSEGAPFDAVSWVYPLEVPASPRVVVLSEIPRRVSVGLLNYRGQFVGVVGNATFEEACVAHPGAFMYVVGKVTERVKGDRVYLNLRSRGWVRVQIEQQDASPETPPKNRRKR